MAGDKPGTGRKRHFSNPNYEIRWTERIQSTFMLSSNADLYSSSRGNVFLDKSTDCSLDFRDAVYPRINASHHIAPRPWPALSLSLHDFFAPLTDGPIRRLILRSTDIAFVKELIAKVTQRGYLSWMKKKIFVFDHIDFFHIEKINTLSYNC